MFTHVLLRTCCHNMSDLSPSTTADIDSDPRVKALTWKYLPDVKTCQEILGACPLGAGHIVALKLGGGNGNNVILVIQKVRPCVPRWQQNLQ